MPIQCHSLISILECSFTSIDVLYGLIQLILIENPKSGWGNPVRGSDTGMGDDVERLHRNFRIYREISNPVAISIDDYARLLDGMLTALTRLDSDGALKDKYKTLADKLKVVKLNNLSQSIHKMSYNFVLRRSLWQQ